MTVPTRRQPMTRNDKFNMVVDDVNLYSHDKASLQHDFNHFILLQIQRFFLIFIVSRMTVTTEFTAKKMRIC